MNYMSFLLRNGMKKLLIATRNQGKLQETKTSLNGLGFKLLTPKAAGIPDTFDVPEEKNTLRQNVLLKAKEYGTKTNLVTLADDTGLFVAALNGRPGVVSRRYGKGDKVRNQKLLAELKSTQDKSAYFKSVIAIYDPESKKLKTVTGIAHGRIVAKPQGNHGFGYDPIFFSATLKKTFAQASLKEKLSASARGRALAKARKILSLWPQNHD